MKDWIRSLNWMLLVPLAAFNPAMSLRAAETYAYQTGYSAILKLGRDLHRRLDPAHRDLIQITPIAIETDPAPFVKLVEQAEGGQILRGVSISAGFVDLVNRVAHAKAIDKIQRGYFQRYLAALAQETGQTALAPLPDDNDPRFWSEAVLNDQWSNFNSIVGVVVGVKLAHHYLGHYQKYASQLRTGSGRQVSINTVLTAKEWAEALKMGASNSLNAGCTIEGVLPFYESFEKMPARPAWTTYFVPETAKYKDIRKLLTQLQKDAFAGRN